jgi:hypothetical protein
MVYGDSIAFLDLAHSVPNSVHDSARLMTGYSITALLCPFLIYMIKVEVAAADTGGHHFYPDLPGPRRRVGEILNTTFSIA